MVEKKNTEKKKKLQRLPDLSNVQMCWYTSPRLFFSFTKHLWICNDVCMHFCSHTKCFGLSSHFANTSIKGLAWPLTDAPIANTWS